MKHINYILLLMSVSFLYALLITTNSPLTLQTHSWVYATSSENEDDSNKVNIESESSQGATDSDQSESNSS